MRGIVALALVALTAVAVAGAASTTRHTALKITYWADAQQKTKPVVWKLRCGPARGTHPRPALACRRLAAGGWQLFAPTQKGAVCTQVYGGPQKARIIGAVEGRGVWSTFARQDGCAIARWNRLAPWLLPAGGVT